VKVPQRFREWLSDNKTRKWILIALISFLALQIYFVQEMLAALILFTGVFVVLAIGALVLYLIDRAWQWSLRWTGQHSRPAVRLARRGWAAVEEISKKPFRRPRSETVR
jgi:predicted lysophospholipase L1 biosynthesis ABC-type transport system permease subunit